jgi:hypothetical protein
LSGPIQDAYGVGHEITKQIADASRTSTRQEIIDKLNLFKCSAEPSLKELGAIARKYPFFREIKDLGPWEHRNVVEKTEILLVLLPINPNQALLETNFASPALQRAGAEWMSAVNSFGVWIADRRQKIAAQRVEYESAQTYK